MSEHTITTPPKASPTPDQIEATLEALEEINGLIYRLQELIEADCAAGAQGLMIDVGPILVDRIGCLAAIAGDLLKGLDRHSEVLHKWLMPAGVAKALKGGAQ